ncbi:hypothetical protein TWF281_008669 [Arthrobotrys megalospora]
MMGPKRVHWLLVILAFTYHPEGGDVNWAETVVPEEDSGSNFFTVTVGRPRNEGFGPAPQIYAQLPPGEKITMEVGVWENAAARFHLQRGSGGGFVSSMHYTELFVKPKDRFWFYWQSSEIRPDLRPPHGSSPYFRMRLAYHKFGSNLRLGFSLTRDSSMPVSEYHPQVQLVASNGEVWDAIKPFTDQERHEYIAAVTGGAQTFSRDSPKETEKSKEKQVVPEQWKTGDKAKSGSIRKFLGKIQKSIFRPKTTTVPIDQPNVEPQREHDRNREEDMDEERKVDSDVIDALNEQRQRGAQWYIPGSRAITDQDVAELQSLNLDVAGNSHEQNDIIEGPLAGRQESRQRPGARLPGPPEDFTWE